MTPHAGVSGPDSSGPPRYWIITGVAATITALTLWGGIALHQFLPNFTLSGRGDSRMTVGMLVIIFGALFASIVVFLMAQGVHLSRLLRVAASEHAGSLYVGVVQTRWQEKIRFVHSSGWVSVLPFAGVLVLSATNVRFVQSSSRGDIVLPWRTVLDVTTEAATAASKPGRIILHLAKPASRFPFSPLDRQWMIFTRPHRRVELIAMVSQIARSQADALHAVDVVDAPSPVDSLPLHVEAITATPIPPTTSLPTDYGRYQASSHDTRQVHRGISAFRFQRWSFIAAVSSVGSALIAFVMLSLGDARVPFIPVAVVLIVGPPLASYFFRVMARIASDQEFHLGYTSYRDKFIDLEQRHPVTGEVIRAAGKPFLTETEWHAVYPGPATTKSADAD